MKAKIESNDGRRLSGDAKRKIIQIALNPNDERCLYALCDDGSLWLGCWGMNANNFEFEWHQRLNEIPQE